MLYARKGLLPVDFLPDIATEDLDFWKQLHPEGTTYTRKSQFFRNGIISYEDQMYQIQGSIYMNGFPRAIMATDQFGGWVLYNPNSDRMIPLRPYQAQAILAEGKDLTMERLYQIYTTKGLLNDENIRGGTGKIGPQDASQGPNDDESEYSL